jgi:hypothetical protein
VVSFCSVRRKNTLPQLANVSSRSFDAKSTRPPRRLVGCVGRATRTRRHWPPACSRRFGGDLQSRVRPACGVERPPSGPQCRLVAENTYLRAPIQDDVAVARARARASRLERSPAVPSAQIEPRRIISDSGQWARMPPPMMPPPTRPPPPGEGPWRMLLPKSGAPRMLPPRSGRPRTPPPASGET